MQIPAGMTIGDVCPFCYEHTNDQPCPEYDAWLDSQYDPDGNLDDTCYCDNPDCDA